LTRYYDSGKKMADINFSEDGSAAYAILYYQNGALAAEGKYISQAKDSVWRYYSYYSKTLSLEESFSQGIKHGESRVFYDNGEVAQIITWENDIKHGPWKQYYEDSSVRLVTLYNNGQLDGRYQIYNKDGILIIDGIYDSDLKTGTWIYYLDDGTVDFELVYIDGVLQNEEVMEEKRASS